MSSFVFSQLRQHDSHPVRPQVGLARFCLVLGELLDSLSPKNLENPLAVGLLEQVQEQVPVLHDFSPFGRPFHSLARIWEDCAVLVMLVDDIALKNELVLFRAKMNTCLSRRHSGQNGYRSNVVCMSHHTWTTRMCVQRQKNNRQHSQEK